jgi:hypothetical protein
MEAICSSETSVPARTTRQYIPEDGIFHIGQKVQGTGMRNAEYR